jgi:GT2 family glycosyltransferase
VNSEIPEIVTHEPTVWITVIHWRAPDRTRLCLDSLKKLSYSNVKIVLVDNGSPDQSGASIGTDYPEVELLPTGKNLGFAGGSNFGIRFALENGAKWIWLLNNDTEVDPASLTILMKAVTDDPKAGVLSATVITESDNEKTEAGFGQIDFLKAKTYLKPPEIESGNALPCAWLAGCNLLLNAEAISQLGAFNEDYYLYFEDTELCHRFNQNGWSCLLVPAARIAHVGGASTQGERQYWRSYYYARNRLLFFLTYCKDWRLIPAVLSIFGHTMRHLLVLPFRGERGQKQLKAELLGTRDFFAKRLGEATCLDWCN